MTFVVDASVAVKCLVNEQASEAAHRLLNSEERLVAPDFIVVEVGNVLWKKLRRGELTAIQAVSGVRELPTYFEQPARSALLAPRAIAIAAALAHPVYDCLYLACAERFESPFVTADARFASIARAAFSGAQVVTLTAPGHI